jgi:hypothetical protein
VYNLSVIYSFAGFAHQTTPTNNDEVFHYADGSLTYSLSV